MSTAQTAENGMLPEMAVLDARRFGRRISRQFPGIRNNNPLARELCNIVYGQICKPKRPGRPPKPEITLAEKLLREYRPQYPRDQKELWRRVCAEALPDWNDLSPRARRTAQRTLKNQISARRSARKKRKSVRSSRQKTAA
jgi:hypothetical protein